MSPNQSFGHWKTIEPVGGAKWLCACVCGEIRPVRMRSLISGHSSSCGCKHRERVVALMSQVRTTHGMSGKATKTRTYRIWANMKSRCGNPRIPAFKNYGGRGIEVCERWKSFENFLSDMGECPTTLTIERVNNDLGYEPSNCRWATMAEQGKNRRPKGRMG